MWYMLSVFKMYQTNVYKTHLKKKKMRSVFKCNDNV